jgi:hypothetical protein
MTTTTKNITMPITFKTSGCNLNSKYPIWTATAYVLGMEVAHVVIESERSTEKRALKEVELEAREYINNFC